MPARPAAEPPRLCAAAVVLRRADPWLSETFEPWRVLLVRRGPSAPFDAGWWSAPCGGVESGDRSIAEAAARELREETGAELAPGARARAQVDELARISETVAQSWSRCDGETPSPAEHWHHAGFVDADVVAWLEAGVPWATSAAELRRVGITPRDVARELDRATGWSLGLVFARGDLTLAEVQRVVLGKEAR